jgi:putative phosphoribosyl transferase
MDADFDVAVARKLQAPGAPELALGAVTPDGARYVNHALVSMLLVPERYLEAETVRQIATAKLRSRFLRGADAAPPVEGRTVVIVDDGLATGATMLAAVRSLHAHHPARLIAAAPVASADAHDLLVDVVDDVICLHCPSPFLAVGMYYQQFDPVDDEEVRIALAARRRPYTAPHASADTHACHWRS